MSDAVTDHKILVDGQWVTTGEWLEVTNPYDGSLVGRVAKADAALTDRAIASAHAAYVRADLPLFERAAVLDRAAAALIARSDELGRTVSLEAGKPLKQATAEVGRAASTLTFSAVAARSLAGELVPMEASAAGVGKLGFIMRVPLGVVGAITPFNFPLNLVAHKLGPSIAAGNPVVLKPASATPISAIKLAEVLLDAGLPADWLQVVCGSGSEVGSRIVEDPAVTAISFTGSPEVGWGIRSQVPHKRVSLELGSNVPLIVAADGDWERAADGARIHAFSHAGQSCISTQRVIVEEAVADEFIARLVANVEALVVGDPENERTNVGALVSEGHLNKVLSYIQLAQQEGGKILCGGKKLNVSGRCGHGYFVEPTVITGLDQLCRTNQEEIFGPVVTLQSFETEEEALQLANAGNYGLSATIWTQDINKANRLANAVQSGIIWVNCWLSRDLRTPFGGMKNSGVGREGGWEALRFFTDVKNVCIHFNV